MLNMAHDKISREGSAGAIAAAITRTGDGGMSLRERIEVARKAAGLTKSELARRVGISPSAVGQWETGETKTLEGENLVRAAAALGVDAQWLATGYGERDPRKVAAEELTYVTPGKSITTVKIPVFDVAGSMGSGTTAPEQETVVGGIQLSAEWVRRHLPGVSKPENLAIISAMGDSMMPTFNDGDLLLVDRGVFEIKLDAVYVLAKGEDLYIKRVQRRLGGGIIIKSDNPLHSPEEVENPQAVHLRVLGRVVWAWNGRRL